MFHKFKLSKSSSVWQYKRGACKIAYSIIKVIVCCLPMLLWSADIYAAGTSGTKTFNLEAGVKAATAPAKEFINEYYPIGIFITLVLATLLGPPKFKTNKDSISGNQSTSNKSTDQSVSVKKSIN